MLSLSLHWLPKDRHRGEPRLSLTGDHQGQGQGCLAGLGPGVDQGSGPHPGSGSQSGQCTAPLCASASLAALDLDTSPCLCFPARHVAMAHGHHRVCVSILGSSAESRAAVSWGPIYPFPCACLSLGERGTRCWAWGHGDPAVPKAIASLLLHPGSFGGVGAPGGPHSSRLPMGRQTHLNR